MALLLLGVLATSTPSYEACKAERTQQASEKKTEKSQEVSERGFFGRAMIFTQCEGVVIDANAVLLTALATIAIAGFTLILWQATSKQAELTRQGIELGNQEFISTHRPKLRVRNVILTHYVPPSVQPLDLIASGQPIKCHLYVVNAGGTSARIVESHCRVFWTKEGALPMGPPYETEQPNNFASGDLEPGVPKQFDFVSAQTMGADAPAYMRLAQDHHIYVMGWVRYEDGAKPARRMQMAFCRLYQTAKGEKHPRFGIVNDPDYEYQD